MTRPEYGDDLDRLARNDRRRALRAQKREAEERRLRDGATVPCADLDVDCPACWGTGTTTERRLRELAQRS